MRKNGIDAQGYGKQKYKLEIFIEEKHRCY